MYSARESSFARSADTGRRPVFRYLLFGLLLGLLLAAGGGFAWYHATLQSPIPRQLHSQAGFNIMYPPKPWSIDKADLRYDTDTKVVTVPAESETGHKITITEQTAPDQFADIPEYYDKFTEKLHVYKRFDSAAGQVSLTKPQELKGTQVAVLYGKGTLLFAQPEQPLTDGEWRSFFDELKIR